MNRSYWTSVISMMGASPFGLCAKVRPRMSKQWNDSDNTVDIWRSDDRKQGQISAQSVKKPSRELNRPHLKRVYYKNNCFVLERDIFGYLKSLP